MSIRPNLNNLIDEMITTLEASKTFNGEIYMHAKLKLINQIMELLDNE